MKHADSRIESEENNVFIIWFGQLLIYGLKCDTHDLAILRPDFIRHMETIAGTQPIVSMQRLLEEAASKFVNIMQTRFELDINATALLYENFQIFMNSFLKGEDCLECLSKLRTVDAWSGLSSCLTNKKMPLSLLDYILDIILLPVSSDLLPELVHSIDELFLTNENANIDKIDKSLDAVAKRLCFNSNLDYSQNNELKLAIMCHLPKEDNDFSMKTGYAFKLLRMHYELTEAK